MKTLKKRPGDDSIQGIVLRNLNVKSIDDITEWFKKYLCHGYRIDKLKEVVDKILEHKNELITIVGDYDVDGISSTSILALGLKWAGCTKIKFRIPKRFSEGFGISSTIIDEIHEGLVITCDNGIAQIEAIRRAKDKGLEVIIIDHHEPVASGELPPADLIIDPMAIPGSADFNGYCGAGLCFKVVSKLLNYDKIKCQKLLALAAIATIADVMQLREENYVIVRYGLKVIEHRQMLPVGLNALFNELKMPPTILASSIAFKIAPCLNACSRMQDDGAKYAVYLMTYDGPYENILGLARQIIDLNIRRKNNQTVGYNEACEILRKENYPDSIPIVVNVPGIPEGVIGPVASNLVEKFNVPAIVVTTTEKGILKGSARSCGNYHMKNKLDLEQKYLLSYGGHSGAGGLSLLPCNFEDFKKDVIANATDFVPEDKDTVYYDAEIEAPDIPYATEELSQYEPFGCGNETPVFKINNFAVIPDNGEYKRIIGPDANIVKLKGDGMSAIGFDMADLMSSVEKPEHLDLLGTLTKNYCLDKNGNVWVTPQVEFFNFRVLHEKPKNALQAEFFKK